MAVMRGKAGVGLGLLGLMGLCVGGCEGSAACVDFSDEVLLTAQVTDNGSRARVEVELRRAELGADSIPVKLCEDNRLQVDDLEMTQIKRPSGAVVHEAMLSAVSEQAVVVRRFTLRSDGDVSEFTAAIDAPGFAIVAPTAGAEVSRAGMLAITWTPARAGDAKIVVKLADEIDGDACLGEAIELEEADDGEVLVGASQVGLAKEGVADDGACAAFVSLARVYSGPLERSRGDASLHPDSLVRATTSRTIDFISVP
jgi:hypothetical protein